MNKKQKATVKISLLVAKKLQSSHPEIKDMYIAGKTLLQIADYLKGQGINNQYLDKSISYAIRGHEGGFQVEPFQGLITDEELLEELAKEHDQDAGRRLYEERKGVHALPMEIRKQHLKKAREVLIQKVRNGEAKIRPLPLEDRLRISRQGIRARGQIPWGELYSDELGFAEDYARELSEKQEYIYQSGGNKGEVKWKKIAEELSQLFNYTFTRHSVYARLIGNPRHRKKGC
jgi:hypothetical protein